MENDDPACSRWKLGCGQAINIPETLEFAPMAQCTSVVRFKERRPHISGSQVG